MATALWSLVAGHFVIIKMTGVDSDHHDFLSISETVTVAVDKLWPVFFPYPIYLPPYLWSLTSVHLPSGINLT